MTNIKMTLMGAVAVAMLSATVPSVSAFAADFSFDVGNVRLGYTDGYWDTKHQWHNWKNADESHKFQEKYKDRYVSDSHTKYKNEGWRDSDGDGVPDRLDKAPNNPHKD